LSVLPILSPNLRVPDIRPIKKKPKKPWQRSEFVSG
jgi:hypothetical protein